MSRFVRGARRASGLALIIAAAVAAPAVARAQSADAIYAGPDLDAPPKLVNGQATARMIQDAYPEQLKRAGINGTVQIQFVVGSNGRVEPGSVEVVAASVPALADAAKQVVEKIEFNPGTANGKAVRARVVLPIVFKAR
jgi:protein TonB